MMLRTILLTATAVSALSAAPAFAQAAPAVARAVDAADSNEILVTARKRSEDIQTVPISITAYTAQDLVDRNIANLNDLTNVTPGIAITSISGGTVLSI